MNNSTRSPSITIVAEHPQPGGDCVLLGILPETKDTDGKIPPYSDARATPPKCARASGGANQTLLPMSGAAATVSPAAGAAHAESAASSVVNWRAVMARLFSGAA